MRLKVTSDGSVWGTRVVDAATGETVEGAVAVRFSHTVEDLPTLTIEVNDFDADVEVEAVVEPAGRRETDYADLFNRAKIDPSVIREMERPARREAED